LAGWAGTYAADDYNHPYNKRTKIKPIKIDFAKRVAYPANDEYPKPFFKTVGDQICMLCPSPGYPHLTGIG
jgi:hypothetical protein